MWSPFYYYLKIAHDLELSAHCDTRALVKFIKTLPELKKNRPFTFKNKRRLPVFTTVLLLNAPAYNSWSDSNTDPEKTNLVVIVCSKNTPENFEKVKAVLIKIAAFLQWQLIDERTDDVALFK